MSSLVSFAIFFYYIRIIKYYFNDYRMYLVCELSGIIRT